jgi:NAD(P)-dependent dehydrogenase (short-subunit alcohol dehydrogenase family)
LTGLRPLLQEAERPSAVAISSNSITTQPGLPADLVDACLGGDERSAVSAASERDALSCYPAAKLALARWVRHNARTSEWAGAGIRLNAVAPGLIATPMTEDAMEFILGLGEVFPIPLGRAGQPSEVAGLLAYLLSPEATFFCGSVVFMDGGTDAALRGDDWPARLGT